MPSHSYSSLRDNPFKDLSDEKIHHELTEEVLQQIMNQLEIYSENEEESLVIFDDVQSELKKSRLQKMFYRMCCNRRHMRVSIIWSLQNFNSAPLLLRKNCSHLVLFRPSNKKEQESVWSECSFLTREKFGEVCDYVFDRPHVFLFISVLEGTYWKGFNRLSIS